MGKDYDKPAEFTPLKKLLDAMDKEGNAIHDFICVTGRTELPPELKNSFDEIYCRDWEPENWDHYYPQYFQWKVDTILKIKPDLVFDDDQQICRYLTAKGLAVIWVPQYAFMGE